MTSTDPTVSAEALAEELLPCGRECHDTLEGFTHVNCCGVYRPAVAAALREKDEEIAALKKLRRVESANAAREAAGYIATIDALESSNAALRKALEPFEWLASLDPKYANLIASIREDYEREKARALSAGRGA